MNGQVASVATVLVRVKLTRPLSVEWGRRRWVGVIRRRILGQGRGMFPGVRIGGFCGSTLKTQTSTAPAIKNVSAH